MNNYNKHKSKRIFLILIKNNIAYVQPYAVQIKTVYGFVVLYPLGGSKFLIP